MLAVTDHLDRDPDLGRIGSELEPRPGRGRPDARADRPGGRRPSALGAAFVLAGLAMIPWVFYLSVTLPASARDAHWSLAWVGLDGCEAVALFATGWFLLRRDNRCVLIAVGSAVLLLVDAWFDVTSAATGPDLATAIVMAVFAEIPIALVCAVLAARVLRTPFPRG
ncbi:hypothetical protein ACFO1B_28595 [Dactylosporangium siamense]|uniref:Uncharacterized protein n=1 Tax=Dactylosporangium siamense TaxID=685454 RepID=A0A919UHH8_9ACTN|nr:hypothetical protein [Dactylosporangium siamense]GIG50683.1 hypothetical protein Dsi01nite_087240 [Dactylosporangium siamense]